MKQCADAQVDARATIYAEHQLAGKNVLERTHSTLEGGNPQRALVQYEEAGQAWSWNTFVFRSSRFTAYEQQVRPCTFLDCHLEIQGIGKSLEMWFLAQPGYRQFCQSIFRVAPTAKAIEATQNLIVHSTRLRPRAAIGTLHRMGYLIGTDEAGYGPNLGPLVISATVWEVPDGVGNEDLHERLAAVVSPRPDKTRVPMADSKSLYSPGKGLKNLELGLWAALGTIDAAPRSWRETWQGLSPGTLERMRSVPWYADHDEPTPIDCDAERCAAAAESFRAGTADAGIKLLAVRSRAIIEEEFNALIDRHGNKGTALSMQTLALAAELIGPLPPGPVSMVCDKHGGRNRYGPLLARHFPDAVVEVRGEGRGESRYRFGPPERRVEVCFRTQAESCLPAALASMASKYLRELAMRALNAFWRRRLPDLKPTAGYPLDAKRFRADIAEEQRRLHIEDFKLWRCV